MACPYFMPVEKFENGSWPHPARLPLGCGWAGHCTAPQHENKVPPQHVLEAFCNLGYATGCPWAPQDRRWDAVRFALTASPEAARGDENSGRLIRICYVIERNHRPVERGELDFDIQGLTCTAPHPDPRLQKMAECYLETRMSRKD